MDDPTKLDYSTCPHCPLTEVDPGYFPKSEEYPEGQLHNETFHSHCQDCDDSGHNHEEDLGVILCAWCKHFRIYHLLRCVLPSSKLIKSVRMDPLREESKDCDLCHFLAQCWADRVPESDLQARSRGLEIGDRVNDEPRIQQFLINEKLTQECLPQGYTTSAGYQGHVKWINWDVLRSQMSSNIPDLDAPSSTDWNMCTQDVRVIDVERRCVSLLPDKADYVALSYVWGSDRTKHAELTTANLPVLEAPGSLASGQLPRTLEDSIECCRRIGQKYLWVDRLCIVQDDTAENMAVQLEQMFAIYHQASFTLVTLAGEDASYGLPGVSLPRQHTQRIFMFKNFSVVQCPPHVEDLIRSSEWYTRGWTYQERQASRRYLYSTDAGMFFHSFIENSQFIHPLSPVLHNRKLLVATESTATTQHIYDQNQLSHTTSYDDMVLEYTEKRLTYSSDILRACAGVLHRYCGSRSFFGLPLDDFDRAIEWFPCQEPGIPVEHQETGIFPSWSWISSIGPKHPVFGKSPVALAYWCRVVTRKDDLTNEATYVETMVPRDSGLRAPHAPLRRLYDYSDLLLVALAWLAGCLPVKAPEDLLIYKDRLRLRWPTYTAYWQEVFANYQLGTVFSRKDIHLATAPGRLMVRAQKTMFKVHHYDQEHRLKRSIRTATGRLVGGMVYDDFASEHNVQHGSVEPAEFIALSVSEVSRYTTPFHVSDHMGSKSKDPYGCCSCDYSRDADSASGVGIYAKNAQHNEECPRHVDFFRANPHISENDYGLSWLQDTGHSWFSIVQQAKHLAAVSYLDENGKSMDPLGYPPGLTVMCITPSKGRGKGTGVYQRVGLGEIYLKRWVEANPEFTNIVLE